MVVSETTAILKKKKKKKKKAVDLLFRNRCCVLQAPLLLLLAAGCTFEEDSDPNLCDFTQGEDDDFDWMLFRTYSSPSASSDLLRGKSSSFLSWQEG
uniref:MAM domain-containing protein n=1 Tax=Poecilia latipinna TaxID=48699 RepID=A0A3B3VP25_9TELE